jgi:DNA-nicking Smr family endonuclease
LHPELARRGKKMGNPIVSIDLHGMFREDAVKAIDRALKAADDSTYQIKLIHGYNRGTSLKNMIMDEYRYHPKVLRVVPGDNLGITVLVLREL